MKTRQANLVHLDSEYVSFKVNDSKGREIGVRIQRSEIDFIEDSTLQCYFRVEPGHYYSFYPCATRNKVAFGASQYAKYFKTREAMEQAIAKYLKSAKGRANRTSVKF